MGTVELHGIEARPGRPSSGYPIVLDNPADLAAIQGTGYGCRVVPAVVAEVGDGRVGVRLSPLISQGDPAFGHAFFGATCTDPEVTYGYAVSGLNERPLAYLLLTEPSVGGFLGVPDDVLPPLRNSRYREIYGGALIGAGGFSPASAALAVVISPVTRG